MDNPENNTSRSSYQTLGKQVLTGSLATVAVLAGEKLLLKMAKHPLLIFGLGMVGGGLVYKNRAAIIQQADKTVTAGKQVILEQKEKMLDLIAEATEKPDQTPIDHA